MNDVISPNASPDVRDSSGKETITTSDEHPFWVEGKGWVDSKNLIVGDRLKTSKGEVLKIDAIDIEQSHAVVYNFTVADYHTYFVSNLGVWVHNRKKCDEVINESNNPSDWKSTLRSGNSTPSGWKISQYVVDQLITGGRFDGKLTLNRIDELMNSNKALRFVDTRSGNINLYVESEFSKKSLLRITIPTKGKTIISIGFNPLKDIEKFTRNGTFIPGN